MNDVFNENNYYMTQQGLKYLMSKEIMNQIEEKEAVNVLANIEMGIEGRLTLVRIIVLSLYIYFAYNHSFSIEIAAVISLLIPSILYYVSDYLALYKMPMFPFLLRVVEMIMFKFFIDKILVLILSITIFHNIWIFICYLGFDIAKYIIVLMSSFLGQNYILFLRKTEAKHNNEIGNYFLKLFD